MRTSAWLGLVVALLGLSRAVLAGPPATSKPAVTSDQQVSDLRKAAEHLEKGGLKDEAAKLRQTIEAMESNRGHELLAQKQKELDALQTEVDRLRDLTQQQPQVALALTIVEVSRAKLEKLDAENFDDLLLSSKAPNQKFSNVRIDLAKDPKRVLEQVESLRKRDLIKILAEPTLITVSRRPAFFSSGGEFPLIVAQKGFASIEFKKWGTQVDFVPIVMGNNRVQLETRVRVSEIDPARSAKINGQTVPGLKVREFDVGYEMERGQMLVVTGNPRTVVELQTDKSGKTREVADSIELVTLITLQDPEAIQRTAAR